MQPTPKAIITGIEIFKISVPLKEPFVLSLGPIYTCDNVVVKIHSDLGISGTGECSPFVTIMGETQDSCFHISKILGEVVKGKNALDIESRIHDMDQAVAFNYTAKSAFDMALYDLASRHANVPLHQFLGEKKEKLMPTDITVSVGSPKKMAKKAKEFVDQGFPVLKVKLGKGGIQDVQRIVAIREMIGLDLPIRIDANQGWQLEEAIATLQSLEAFNIQHCEAPIARWDLEGLHKVRSESPIPIMADDSLFTPHDAQRLFKAQACDRFNIKLAKSGGIFHALEILQLAEKNGIPCQAGSMGESRYGITALAHLAASQKPIVFYDMDLPLLQAADPVEGGLVYGKGWTVHLDDLPGVGASFEEGFLKKGEWTII